MVAAVYILVLFAGIGVVAYKVWQRTHAPSKFVEATKVEPAAPVQTKE